LCLWLGAISPCWSDQSSHFRSSVKLTRKRCLLIMSSSDSIPRVNTEQIG
jgi:hypothetical protein